MLTWAVVVEVLVDRTGAIAKTPVAPERDLSAARGLTDVGQGDDRDDDADGHADQEPHPPRRRVRERATDDQAETGTESGGRAVGGDGASALRALGNFAMSMARGRSEDRRRVRRTRGGRGERGRLRERTCTHLTGPRRRA